MALLALVGAGAGCRARAERLPVGAVRAQVSGCLLPCGSSACPAEAQVGVDELKAEVQRRLDADPRLQRSARRDAPRLTAVLGRTEGGAELRLELAATAPAATLPATVEVPLAGPHRQHLAAAVTAACLRLGDRLVERGEAAAALLVRLADPATPPASALAAAELLAARGETRATAPLAALVARHPQPEVLLPALGAMVRLGDPGAVPTLVDLSAHQPREVLLPMVTAIGQLGGELAEAFLTTMASGHPDPRVAQAAEEALSGH